jgi:hypothetical protein
VSLEACPGYMVLGVCLAATWLDGTCVHFSQFTDQYSYSGCFPTGGRKPIYYLDLYNISFQMDQKEINITFTIQVYQKEEDCFRDVRSVPHFRWWMKISSTGFSV